MASPLFNMLGGAKMPQQPGTAGFINQLQQFKNQMGNVDPNKEIQKLLQSGRISQQQLDQAQQMAQQMQGLLKG